MSNVEELFKGFDYVPPKTLCPTALCGPLGFLAGLVDAVDGPAALTGDGTKASLEHDGNAWIGSFGFRGQIEGLHRRLSRDRTENGGAEGGNQTVFSRCPRR